MWRGDRGAREQRATRARGPHAGRHDVGEHVDGFQLIFYVSAGIALAGAVTCLVLVRKADRRLPPVFGRRSRWILANVGTSPGLTRQPPPAVGAGGP
jgi:hypothetical protein